jgi:hypothetical protein
MTAGPPATADAIVTRKDDKTVTAGKMCSPPFSHPQEGAKGVSGHKLNSRGTPALTRRALKPVQHVASVLQV